MVKLVSGVEFSDSSLMYNTQCSSQVPSLIPITYFTHPPLPRSGYHQFVLYSLSLLWFAFLSIFLFLPLCSFVLFFSIPHISEIIQYLSFSDLFCLALYSLTPSMLLKTARFHSFVLLNNIPLYVYVCVCVCINITSSLSTHLLMGTWAASIIWLL